MIYSLEPICVEIGMCDLSVLRFNPWASTVGLADLRSRSRHLGCQRGTLW